MTRKILSLALGALVAAGAAMAPSAPIQAAAGIKYVNVHGDPKIVLALTPSYLPDGKVEDLVHLVNRSDEPYCFRFEVYDDAWAYVRRRVNIVTAPPGSAYEVTRIKIFAAGGKYRYKMDGMYWSKTGIEGKQDCRKAFPAGYTRTMRNGGE